MCLCIGSFLLHMYKQVTSQFCEYLLKQEKDHPRNKSIFLLNEESTRIQFMIVYMKYNMIVVLVHFDLK